MRMRTADNVRSQASSAGRIAKDSDTADHRVIQLLCAMVEELAGNVSDLQREVDELKRAR